MLFNDTIDLILLILMIYIQLLYYDMLKQVIYQ